MVIADPTRRLVRQSEVSQFAADAAWAAGPFKGALDSLSPALVLNSTEFAVYPDDLTQDSTAGLQAAINKMETENIGHLIIPSMNLLVNGEIRIKKPMHISGAYGATLPNTAVPYERKGGTSIVTNGGVAGSFVFDIAPGGLGRTESGTPTSPENGGDRILGFKMENLYFYGGAQADPVDRGGIRMVNVHTELFMEDLKFINFKRQGLLFNGVYDGTLKGITLFTTGSATYPAFDLMGNSNALHIFGLHIESCWFPLRLGAASRHNQFIGGKIEMYTYGATSSPIQVLNAYENVFAHMQFVQRNADDTFFYANSTVQPHMILCDGVTSRTIFDSCMWTTQHYQGGSSTHYGARWIKSLAGVVQIRGGVMETCWGGDGAKSIMLGSKSIMTGVHLYSRGKNGVRNLLELGADCIVDSCLIDASDANTAMTGGVLVTATGEDNTWGSSNKIRCTVSQYVSATGRQHFKEMERTTVNLPAGNATPNLGWSSRGNSRMFSIFQGSTPTTWTGHSGQRVVGDEIQIVFSDVLTTIQHGDFWKLKGSVNVTPPAGAYMYFRYNGTSYAELWRTF